MKCQEKFDENCEGNGNSYYKRKRVCNYCFWKLKNGGKSHNAKVYRKSKNGIFVKSATFKMGEIKPK